jgi:hypothetical protein
LILDKFVPKPGEVTSSVTNIGKDAVAKASQLKDTIAQKLAEKVPERAGLAKEYALSMKKKALLKNLAKKAGIGAGSSVLGGLGYLGYKGVKSLLH